MTEKNTTNKPRLLFELFIEFNGNRAGLMETESRAKLLEHVETCMQTIRSLGPAAAAAKPGLLVNEYLDDGGLCVLNCPDDLWAHPDFLAMTNQEIADSE